MNNWGVVIVLYNPNLNQLNLTLTQILPQTRQVALVNNGPSLQKEGIVLRPYELGDNKGIAYAQNYGVALLKKRNPNLEYVFFLDQDSEISSSFFSSMLKAWQATKKRYSNLAALSPKISRRTENGNYSTLFFDQQGLHKRNVDFSQEPLLINTLPISSGLLVSVDAFEKVGGLSEKWFIDWVDFDFDLKLLTQGYTVATTGAASIIHEIGTPNRRNFLGKKIAVTNYVLFREYYTARNGVYLIRKYGRKGKGIAKYSLGQIARRFIMLLYEPKKVRRFGTLMRGMLAGLVTSYD